MVLVEAMAAGKPVIALDASGAREVVKDGQNGRLLDEDTSPETFAGAVSEYAQESERAEAWKKEALKTARAYSRRRVVKDLLELYEDALIAHPTESASSDEMLSWEKLLRSLTAEWSLLSQKAAAAVNSFREETDL